jgi:putative restriction endonuclease
MKYWVGVTHNPWFEFLSREQPDEVDFWQPSGRPPFVGLEPGSPFLFKLKSPFNHVAGGGYFVKFTTLPLSLAWEAFGRKNGVESFEAFAATIRGLARSSGTLDPNVGCNVLTQPFFWPRERWIPLADWSKNVVTGRYYDTSRPDGAALWDLVRDRAVAVPDAFAERAPRYGSETTVRHRLGQGAFQVMVLDAYRRRCAITGESTLPVLEAAHILPFAENGPNELANGMLLRADFHKLFDRGLITVTPALRIEISSRIREQWFNGKVYYRLHGERLANLPADARDHPDPAHLAWHNEHCFQA